MKNCITVGKKKKKERNNDDNDDKDNDNVNDAFSVKPSFTEVNNTFSFFLRQILIKG